MGAVGRYHILDDYTGMELRRRYQSADTAGRLSLLREISAREDLPYELALMAVEDEDSQVRWWMARYGTDLSYTRHFHRTENGWLNEMIEPSLADKLRNDPDPLVRSALRENPAARKHVLVEDEFKDANHTERLALMRNPEMSGPPSSKEFVELLFDPDDTTLNINMTEREDLILAFLTNTDSINRLKTQAGLLGSPKKGQPTSYNDISLARDTNEFLNHVWELAAKWPMSNLPAVVPELTFRRVPVKDETKAKIYQNCNVPILRRAILQSSSEEDIETLKLGVRDEDDDCRGAARDAVDRFNLGNRIVAYPEFEPKGIIEKLRRWQGRNEDRLSMLGFLAIIACAMYWLLYTERGNQLFGKFLEFYSTSLGMVVVWLLGGITGFIVVGIISVLVGSLAMHHRWFYHCFWLGLIGSFYIFAESQVMTQLLACYYAASIILPKLWEELSNELVNKIAARIEATKVAMEK